MSTERVLVTGGSGFIGRHVVPRLVGSGYDVHLVTRRPGTNAATRGHEHLADLHDHDRVERIVAEVRPTVLLHLAWDVTPGTYVTSLENLRWVQSTLALVRAFAAAGGRRVVGAGTSAEYDWRFGWCSEARTPLKPATLYAASKHGLCEIIGRLAAQLGFGFAWGRVFFMYGPAEAPERLVPAMIRAAVDGTPLALRHPEQIRDYIHVDDVGAAFAALVGSAVQGPVNIGSGSPIALRDLAALVGAAAGREVRLDTPSSPVEDPFPVVVADISRLRHEVPFSPRLALADGLRAAVSWWSRHPRTVQA